MLIYKIKSHIRQVKINFPINNTGLIISMCKYIADINLVRKYLKMQSKSPDKGTKETKFQNIKRTRACFYN